MNVISSKGMSRLTSRQRILTASRRGIPDTVPVCPRGVQPLARIYGGAYPSQSDMIRASRDLDFDCVLHWHPREKLAPGVEVREVVETTAEGKALRRTVVETPAGVLERATLQIHAATDANRASALASAVEGQGLIRSESDLELLETLHARVEPEDVRGFAELEAEMGENGVVQAEVVSPVNYAVRDIGAENLMLFYMDDPPFARRILDVYQKVALWQEEALLEAGARIIYCDCAWGTPELWSPAQIDDLLVPLMQQQAWLAHEAGALFHVFMDGNSMAALGSIARMGADILSPLETPPTGDMDVAEVKRRIGDRMCLWGGVNACFDVARGPVEHVREAVRRAISAGAPGGGYVLSTADSVYDPCPLEHVKAFFAAGREFGSYPI